MESNKNVLSSSVQKPHLPLRSSKLPCLMWGGIGPRTEISGSSDVPFTMVPRLHQRNLYIKRRLKVWRVQKCTPLVGAKTALTCAGLKTISVWCEAVMARERKFRATFSHGTVFAPQQCLYGKEAAGMESIKMYYSCRIKSRTYLCGPANYHVSCKAVYGRERKFPDVLMYLSPWYHVCTKVIFISKRSYGYGESNNVFL